MFYASLQKLSTYEYDIWAFTHPCGPASRPAGWCWHSGSHRRSIWGWSLPGAAHHQVLCQGSWWTASFDISTCPSVCLKTLNLKGRNSRVIFLLCKRLSIQTFSSIQNTQLNTANIKQIAKVPKTVHTNQQHVNIRLENMNSEQVTLQPNTLSLSLEMASLTCSGRRKRRSSPPSSGSWCCQTPEPPHPRRCAGRPCRGSRRTLLRWKRRRVAWWPLQRSVFLLICLQSERAGRIIRRNWLRLYTNVGTLKLTVHVSWLR